MKRLLGFDFSAGVLERRQSVGKPSVQHIFKIELSGNSIGFILEENSYFLDVPFKDPLCHHLILKMILNTHSTLIMGRLGRYQGNVMTYVKASNNKLIDRSIRYVDLILRSRGISVTYSEICYALYDVLESMPLNQSVVLNTVDRITSGEN